MKTPQVPPLPGMAPLGIAWRNTPRDYRTIIDGERYVMVLRDGGTQLVPLSDLTAEEIARKGGAR